MVMNKPLMLRNIRWCVICPTPYEWCLELCVLLLFQAIRLRIFDNFWKSIATVKSNYLMVWRIVCFFWSFRVINLPKKTPKASVVQSDRYPVRCLACMLCCWPSPQLWLLTRRGICHDRRLLNTKRCPLPRESRKQGTNTHSGFLYTSPRLLFWSEERVAFSPSLLLSSPLLFLFFSFFFFFFFSPVPSSVLVPQQVVAGSSRILGDCKRTP